jgi:hypothetical protein
LDWIALLSNYRLPKLFILCILISWKQIFHPHFIYLNESGMPEGEDEISVVGVLVGVGVVQTVNDGQRESAKARLTFADLKQTTLSN